MVGANHTGEIFNIEGGQGIIDRYNYQIQFSMMISGVSEWEYILYNPDCLIPEFRLYFTTIKRDEKIISLMQAEISKFMAELKEYTARLVEVRDKIRGTK